MTVDYDECITPTNTLLGDVCCFVCRAKDPRPAQHDEYTLAGRTEGERCAPKELKIAPLLLTDSAYVYGFNRRVAFWAERFGESDVAGKCRAEAARIKAAFNREFYRGEGVYAGGELTSLAAPLYFKGLCADGDATALRTPAQGGGSAIRASSCPCGCGRSA